MFRIYASGDYRIAVGTAKVDFLDSTAQDLFQEGATFFHHSHLVSQPIIQHGAGAFAGIIEVSGTSVEPVCTFLQDVMRRGVPAEVELADAVPEKHVEKFDEFLPADLLNEGFGEKSFSHRLLSESRRPALDSPHTWLGVGSLREIRYATAACASESKIKRMLSSKVRKAAISNEMLGRVEVEFANNPKSAGTRDLTRIDDLVTQLEKAAKDRTILLLIDEIQHLATSDDFSGLAHSLRTLLDRRQGRVKSIYTGSSRHYMHLLMSTQSSPFYHFANLHRFPDLGEDFCAFLQNKMASEYGIAVAKGSLVKAFGDLDHSPYWMQRRGLRKPLKR